MALRDIVSDKDNILRKRSREVTEFNEKLSKLLDDMVETLKKVGGSGLAAPQVGILRRAVIVKDGKDYVEMINPVIISVEGEQLDYEACLSVKNRSCKVSRPKKVKMEYYDRKGKKVINTFEGWEARACCHELDHLDGILFYDKAYKD